MKACTKCGVEKPEEEFAKNGKFGRHTACKECARNSAKLARLNNPDKFREADRNRYINNKDARRAANKEYCDRNKERRSEQERARYASKREEIKQSVRQYRKANHSKVYALNGKRRARCSNATPSWADLSAIEAIYAMARRMTKETGVVHHVDHVFPLLGKTVSGLHVESNLRVITAQENMAKGCRVEL